MKTKTKTEKKELETFVIETTFLTRTHGMDFGWGNGYVVIPKGHKYHGLSYDEIMNKVGTSQELTFGRQLSGLDADAWKEHIKNIDPESWVVGFDTAHYNDTLERWPKKAVEAATKQLAEELNE